MPNASLTSTEATGASKTAVTTSWTGISMKTAAGYAPAMARKTSLASLLVSGFATAGLAVAQGFTLVVGMLVLQATSIPVFFPAGLVAISRLTDYADRSAFTGATLAVGVVVGTGIAPTLLGFIADIRDFQTGIFFQGVLTMLACVLLPLLRKIRQ